MTHLTNLTIDEVYKCLTIRENIRKYDSEITIMGKPGPTGKTALFRRLVDDGYYAHEISEELSALVTYNDDDNHVIINELTGDAIVVLNKPL